MTLVISPIAAMATTAPMNQDECPRTPPKRKRETSEANSDAGTQIVTPHASPERAAKIAKIVGDTHDIYGSPLGAGACGSVYNCKNPNGNTPLVKKKSNARFLFTKCAATLDLGGDPQAEALALKFQTTPPHVVRIRQITTLMINNREVISAVTMDKVVGGQTLNEWLMLNPPPTKEQIIHISRQIAEAVSALNEKEKVAHRDLKMENIMIDDKLNVTIVDLGLLTKITPLKTASLVGTELYFAPEHRNKGTLHKTDAWAMGLIFFQLSHHGEFYDECDELPEADGYDKVIKGLLMVEPEDRLTATEALNQLKAL